VLRERSFARQAARRDDLDTSTAITGQSAKRARLSPALRISLSCTRRLPSCSRHTPRRVALGLPCWSESSRALFRGAVSRGQLLGPNLVRLPAPACVAAKSR